MPPAPTAERERRRFLLPFRNRFGRDWARNKEDIFSDKGGESLEEVGFIQIKVGQGFEQKVKDVLGCGRLD